MTVEELDAELISNKFVFLTGEAGTGKSFLTKQLIKKYDGKCLVTASTGTAALNIGGITVHKAFGLGLSANIVELEAYDRTNIKNQVDRSLSRLKTKSSDSLDPEIERDEFKKAEFFYHKRIKDRLSPAKLIIIDEVSMLSANIIEMILFRLSSYNLNNMMILLVGDFLQLPYVSKTKTREYAFENKAWNKFKTIQLSEVKRTTDPTFINVLSKVRKGLADKEVIDFLSQRTVLDIPKDFGALHSLKAEVDRINKENLEAIDELAHTFNGLFREGDHLANEQKQTFLKNLSTPDILTLKKGCRVMFTVNDFANSQFVNGDQGMVERIERNIVYVKKDSDVNTNKLVEVARFRFVQNRLVTNSNNEILMTPEIVYEQFPLTLAYAITIHKAQGATMDSVGVDCAGIFEFGQFYVAISRAKDPNKLLLKNFHPGYIQADKRVLDFYEKEENLCQ